MKNESNTFYKHTATFRRTERQKQFETRAVLSSTDI
jgi:hypothetical protein